MTDDITQEPPVKRKRGRPKGSKNKAKQGVGSRKSVVPEPVAIADLIVDDFDPKETEEYLALREKHHPVRLENGCWQIRDFLIPAMTEINALLYAARDCTDPEEMEYLFWECADLWWKQDPEEPKFVRHRWADWMIKEACAERFLSIGGAGSSGKSWTMAGWAIFHAMRKPWDTSVVITSTSLKDATGRIWGAVTQLMELIEGHPFNLRNDLGSFAYMSGKTRTQYGIQLISADKSQSKHKVGKLIGRKAGRMILIADELTDISPNIQEAATGNLIKNPHFQMVAMANPSSRFDPFGVFSMPQGGWDAVNVETEYEWRTSIGGKFIRLDAEDSPNFDSEERSKNKLWRLKEPFHILPTRESLERELDATGAPDREAARKTRNYMRFNRAIFFDSDETETVYTEADIRKYGAENRTEILRPVKVAGVDLSFSSGGDKTVMCVCSVGYDSYGQFCVQIEELVYLVEDMSNKEDPRTLQIVELIRKECVRRKIKPEDVAIDASGGGGGVCDMLQLHWSDQFLRVQFGGKASDRRIKNDSKVTARERYANRASELFFVGRQYLIARQIYGIPPVIIKQMTSRTYDTKKTSAGVVLQVEPKSKYKLRVGGSPDETDAFCIAVELARTRHGWLAADPITERKGPSELEKYLKSRQQDFQRFDPSMLGHSANLV